MRCAASRTTQTWTPGWRRCREAPGTRGCRRDRHRGRRRPCYPEGRHGLRRRPGEQRGRKLGPAHRDRPDGPDEPRHPAERWRRTGRDRAGAPPRRHRTVRVSGHPGPKGPGTGPALLRRGGRVSVSGVPPSRSPRQTPSRCSTRSGSTHCSWSSASGSLERGRHGQGASRSPTASGTSSTGKPSRARSASAPRSPSSPSARPRSCGMSSMIAPWNGRRRRTRTAWCSRRFRNMKRRNRYRRLRGFSLTGGTPAGRSLPRRPRRVVLEDFRLPTPAVRRPRCKSSCCLGPRPVHPSGSVLIRT